MIKRLENKRVFLLDEIRGFAIICMVVYHAMFDLSYFFDIDVPVFFDSWFYIIRDIFAGMFIFISGSVCIYSKNNFKRGVQCFFIGMIMTFVTAFVVPDAPIYFGILHLLGICMMIYALFDNFFKNIMPILSITLFGLIFFICFNLPDGYIGIEKIFTVEIPTFIYNAELLFPLGFRSYTFTSTDYFPLLPWLFLFLAGTGFGQLSANNSLPDFFYRPHIKFLGITGRYTIWIYVLHQPVLYFAFSMFL